MKSNDQFVNDDGDTLVCNKPHCKCMDIMTCSNHHYGDSCWKKAEESIEKIRIIDFRIIVDKNKEREMATLVGYDREGNEYTFDNRVYIHGESHKVVTDIIQTKK